jgi:hypothetical protein
MTIPFNNDGFVRRHRRHGGTAIKREFIMHKFLIRNNAGLRTGARLAQRTLRQAGSGRREGQEKSSFGSLGG